MFVRKHFDAASLFPAMVIMTSIAVTLNVYVALEDNMASRLNGRSIPMLECSFEENGKCVKLDKNEQKRSRRMYGEENVNYFGE